MTNALLEILRNFVVLIGAVIVISFIGASALLGLDKINEKRRERKKK